MYNRVVRFKKFFEVFVKLLFVYRIGLWQRLVCIGVLENLESIDFSVVKKSVAHHNAERHYAEPVFLFTSSLASQALSSEIAIFILRSPV